MGAVCGGGGNGKVDPRIDVIAIKSIGVERIDKVFESCVNILE